MKEIFFGLVRHALTTGGGALGADGLVTGDQVKAAAGAVMTLVGVIGSIVHKVRARD